MAFIKFVFSSFFVSNGKLFVFFITFLLSNPLFSLVFIPVTRIRLNHHQWCSNIIKCFRSWLEMCRVIFESFLSKMCSVMSILHFNLSSFNAHHFILVLNIRKTINSLIPLTIKATNLYLMIISYAKKSKSHVDLIKFDDVAGVNRKVKS
jgi:hypothetical protein